MKKSDLIKKIMYVDKSIDLAQAKVIFDTIIDSIVSAIKEGHRVGLRTFGTFVPCEKAAHETTNPATGERVRVGTRKFMRFKAGRILNQKINTYKEVVK